jgi:hypothetical protein
MVGQQPAIIDDSKDCVWRRGILGLPVCIELYYSRFQFVGSPGHIGYFISESDSVRTLIRADDSKALAVLLQFLIPVIFEFRIWGGLIEFLHQQSVFLIPQMGDS